MSKKENSRHDLEAQIIAHAWKDPNFKRELLSNPRAALKKMNFPFKENTQIKVIEETENQLIIVLPPAPTGLKELSETQVSEIAAGTGCFAVTEIVSDRKFGK